MANLKDLIVQGPTRAIGRIYAPNGLEGVADISIRLGTATVGGTSTPIYLDGGLPKAITGFSAATINAGTLSADRLPTSGVTAGSYGPSANTSPDHGGTFSVPYVTVDNKGRLTAASTKTITLPAQYSHPTYTAATSGLYKITVNTLGHVSATAAVTASDLPDHTHNYVPNTQAGVNAALNLLSEGSSVPSDNDYYISQYVNGGTTTTTYHRRPVSKLWDLFKTKISATNSGSGSVVIGVTQSNGAFTVSLGEPQVTVTNPTTQTNYGILFAADPNTTERNTLRKNNNFRFREVVGAANTEGFADIILGNATAKTADNNLSGSIVLYGDGVYNTRIFPETGYTEYRTVKIPNANGSMMLQKKQSSFWGIIDGDGSDTSWIRTPKSGLIPYAPDNDATNGNATNIGSATWHFKAAYVNDYVAKEVTATTLGTVSGSTFLKGNNLIGNQADWAGIQAHGANDRFQLFGWNNRIVFRQNDNTDTAVTDANWMKWVAFMAPEDISGSGGITVTPGTDAIGTGTDAVTVPRTVTISHSNSITAVTTAAFKKFKYDAQGHITGTADVAAADLPSHTHSYIPLAGSNAVTGAIKMSATNMERAFAATDTSTATTIWMGVGSGHVNHGMYSDKLNAWMVYADDSTHLSIHSKQWKPATDGDWSGYLAMPLFANAVGDGGKKLVHNDGIRYEVRTGTTSADGGGRIVLGNATASGTAGNKTGSLRMFSPSTYYGTMTPTTLTANRSYTLPDKDGTVALVGDIPSYSGGTGISIGTGNVINHSNSITAITTAAFKKFKYDAQGHITDTADVTASDLPSHTHSYLPLTGGTVSGNINFKSSTYDATLANNGVTSTQYPTTFDLLDKNGNIMVRNEGVIGPDGTIGWYAYVRNYATDGTMVNQKGIKFVMNKAGNLTYTVSDAAAFRTAIGDPQNSVLQSATTTANYRPLLSGVTNKDTAQTGLDTTVTGQVYASNNFFVQPSTGKLFAKHLLAHDKDGGSVSLEFWRASNRSHRIINESGALKFQTNYTADTSANWTRTTDGAYSTNVFDINVFNGAPLPVVTLNSFLRHAGYSSAWWNDRDNAVVQVTTAGSGYYPIIATKTKNSGSWAIGNHNDDTLVFNYISSTQYAAKTNPADAALTQIRFTSTGSIRAKSESTGFEIGGAGGRIVHYDGKGPQMYLTSSGNWAMGTSYYLNNTTTKKGFIGAYGSATAVDYFAIGPDYNNHTLKIFNNNTGLINLRGTTPQIQFTNTTTDKGCTTAGIWCDAASIYGLNMYIQSSGNVVIGSGESPVNFKDATKVTTDNWIDAGENMYVMSDGDLLFFTKCNTITDRTRMLFSTAGNLWIPTTGNYGWTGDANGFSGSITHTTFTATRTWTMPDKTGTVALVSDIPTYTGSSGISVSGTSITHSNSITAVTTAAFKKIKYDAQGHITGTADVAASDLPSHTHDYLPTTTTYAKSTSVNGASYNSDVTVTNPTSQTDYGMIFVANPNTTEANILRKNNNFRFRNLLGTASAEGKANIILGNNVAKGTANNETGRITLYADTTHWVDIVPVSGMNADRTINITNANGNIALEKKQDNYWGMIDGDGSDTNWIRSTKNGFIPYAPNSDATNGLVSKLGTSTWSFKEAWIDDVQSKNLVARLAVRHVAGSDGSYPTNTINNISGSGFIYGNNIIGNAYDWVGLQAHTSADKFQILAGDNRILFRQNDSGGTDATNWQPWVRCITPGDISGENGITVTQGTESYGTGTDAVTIPRTVKIGHSNSISAVTTAGFYKVKFDAYGHITGTTAVAKADITGLGIPGSNTDEKVKQTADSSTNTAIPVLLKNASTSGTAADSKYNANVTVTPSTGTVTATKYNVNSKATMEYDSGLDAIKFVFS